MATNPLYGCSTCKLAISCENVGSLFTPPCAKLADKNLTDLQQLQAKIRAYYSELNDITNVNDILISDVMAKLRELSAVQ